MINRHGKKATSSSIFKYIEISQCFVGFLLSPVISVSVSQLCAESIYLLSLLCCLSSSTWPMLISRERCDMWPTHSTYSKSSSTQSIFRSLVSVLGSWNSVFASSGVRQKKNNLLINFRGKAPWNKIWFNNGSTLKIYMRNGNLYLSGNLNLNTIYLKQTLRI